MATAVVLLLVSVSAFGALSFYDFSEPRPGGAQAAPASDASVRGLSEPGVLDSDLDGAPDALENFLDGSDPYKWNTSGTRIPDGWLIRYAYEPTDPAVEHHPAAAPPLEALGPAYRNAWPDESMATLWEVYSWQRPADWDEALQGPYDSGLDPTRWDNNGDGIADGWLLRYGLDPLAANVSDQRLAGPDGLTVREAFRHDTDPGKVDTDGDGLSDREEIDGPRDPTAGPADPPRFAPSDPRRFSTTQSDVCDGYLVAYGLDPSEPDHAYGDLGRSGATTVESFLWSQDRFGAAACAGQGLDPTVQSTVGGPIPDGWLIRYGLDPLDAEVPDKVTQSSDDEPDSGLPTDASGQPELPHVTLTVLDEYTHGRPGDWDEAALGPWWGGTDPSRPDTDQDGVIDSVELRGYYVSAITSVGPSQEEDARFLHATSDPTAVDGDGDGLSDLDEISVHGTDPSRRDTDMDGIPDAVELDDEFGLDPTRADSAGDFLRDGVRLDALRSRVQAFLDDPEAPYEYPGEPGVPRTIRDWIVDLPGADEATSLSTDDVAALLGPGGDLDGDESINILDSDMDGDGLLNGWELDPVMYRHSQFGQGVLPRPASDPLNPDTDGDGLRDGWEVEHGRAVFCPSPCETHYSLDPGGWDSDGNGVSDAKEDPDGDSTQWVRFVHANGETVADVVPFPFPNELEQEADTDPNEASTSGDGLVDGWKYFWGTVYPNLGGNDVGLFDPVDAVTNKVRVPDGMTKPAVGQEQADVVVATGSYTRFLLDSDHVTPNEQAIMVHQNVPDRDGDGIDEGQRNVLEVEGIVEFGLLDAQSAGTNPYLVDTSGDSVPDWWAHLHRRHLAGTPIDAADCAAAARLDPLTHYPVGEAIPGGALSIRDEYANGTHPLCDDTDMDGLPDAYEIGVPGLDPLNPSDADAAGSVEDADGDGVTDLQEVLGVQYEHLGDRFIHTQPEHPDSDGDGLLDADNVILDPNDGQDQGWIRFYLDLGIAYERTSGSTHFFGEVDQDAGSPFWTSPTEPDDSDTGVPAGWLVRHGRNPNNPGDDLSDQYLARMPAWWNQHAHGPWWGGAGPAPSLDNDLDNDGLADFNDADGAGFEDPLPAANTVNLMRPLAWATYPPTLGLPTSPPDLPPDALTNQTLPPLVRRLVAQSYLNQRLEADQGFVFDPPDEPCHPSPVFETTGPHAMRLEDAAGQPVQSLVKGTPVWLHGRLTYPANHACAVAHTGGLHGVTVEARFKRPGDHPQHVFGVGFTNETGVFGFPVNVSSEQSVPLGSPDDADHVPVVLRGETSGIVTWSPDPAVVAPGNDRLLLVRSYASPDSEPFTTFRPPLSAAVYPKDFRVSVHAGSEVVLDVPNTVTTGGSFKVGFRLIDSTGTPLRDQVDFFWPGGDVSKTPGVDGRGQVTLAAPHGLGGLQTITVTSDPAGGGFVTPATTQHTLRLRDPVQLRIPDLASQVDAGESIDVRGTVILPSGGGVADAPITLNLTGTPQPVAGFEANTTDGGSFFARMPLPATLAHGRYSLLATVHATDETAELVVSQPVTVRGRPAFQAVTTDGILHGETIDVAGTLRAPDGSPLADASVRIQLETLERSATTDESGRFSVTITSDLPQRPVHQSLYFDGDARHAPVAHHTERSVLSVTTIALPSGTMARGADASFPVRLTAGDGEAVSGARIRVTWGDAPATTHVTGPDGTATFHRPGDAADPLGRVTIRAEYAGSLDGSRAGSLAVASWNIVTAAEIVLPEGVFEAGAPIPAGVLRDAGTGQPLAEAPVTVQRGAEEPRAVVTDAEGSFAVLPETPATSGPMHVRVTVVFAGTDTYDPTSAETTVAIRTPVAVEVYAPPAIVVDQPVLATFNVRGLDGVAVDGGTVEVTLSGQPVGNATVAQGSARITVRAPMDAAPGPNSLVFDYQGTESYGPGQAEASVLVKRPVELSVMVRPGTPGGLASIQVQATSGGEPVPFANVYLRVGDADGGVTAMTDEGGVAMFTVEQTVEAAKLSVRFQGGTQLSPAYAAASFEPLPPVTPAETATRWVSWVAFGTFAVLTILAPIIYRLRRSPLAPGFRHARDMIRGRGPYEERILRAYAALEEAAIGQNLMSAVAPTPRLLEQSIAPGIPSRTHEELDRLISLFELARYATVPMGPEHGDEALECLDSIRLALREDAGLTWRRRSKLPMGVPA